MTWGSDENLSDPNSWYQQQAQETFAPVVGTPPPVAPEPVWTAPEPAFAPSSFGDAGDANPATSGYSAPPVPAWTPPAVWDYQPPEQTYAPPVAPRWSPPVDYGSGWDTPAGMDYTPPPAPQWEPYVPPEVPLYASESQIYGQEGDYDSGGSYTPSEPYRQPEMGDVPAGSLDWTTPQTGQQPEDSGDLTVQNPAALSFWQGVFGAPQAALGFFNAAGENLGAAQAYGQEGRDENPDYLGLLASATPMGQINPYNALFHPERTFGAGALQSFGSAGNLDPIGLNSLAAGVPKFLGDVFGGALNAEGNPLERLRAGRDSAVENAHDIANRNPEYYGGERAIQNIASQILLDVATTGGVRSMSGTAARALAELQIARDAGDTQSIVAALSKLRAAGIGEGALRAANFAVNPNVGVMTQPFGGAVANAGHIADMSVGGAVLGDVGASAFGGDGAAHTLAQTLGAATGPVALPRALNAIGRVTRLGDPLRSTRVNKGDLDAPDILGQRGVQGVTDDLNAAVAAGLRAGDAELASIGGLPESARAQAVQDWVEARRRGMSLADYRNGAGRGEPPPSEGGGSPQPTPPPRGGGFDPETSMFPDEVRANPKGYQIDPATGEIVPAKAEADPWALYRQQMADEVGGGGADWTSADTAQMRAGLDARAELVERTGYNPNTPNTQPLRDQLNTLRQMADTLPPAQAAEVERQAALIEQQIAALEGRRLDVPYGDTSMTDEDAFIGAGRRQTEPLDFGGAPRPQKPPQTAPEPILSQNTSEPVVRPSEPVAPAVESPVAPQRETLEHMLAAARQREASLMDAADTYGYDAVRPQLQDVQSEIADINRVLAGQQPTTPLREPLPPRPEVAPSGRPTPESANLVYTTPDGATVSLVPHRNPRSAPGANYSWDVEVTRDGKSTRLSPQVPLDEKTARSMAQKASRQAPAVPEVTPKGDIDMAAGGGGGLGIVSPQARALDEIARGVAGAPKGITNLGAAERVGAQEGVSHLADVTRNVLGVALPDWLKHAERIDALRAPVVPVRDAMLARGWIGKDATPQQVGRAITAHQRQLGMTPGLTPEMVRNAEQAIARGGNVNWLAGSVEEAAIAPTVKAMKDLIEQGVMLRHPLNGFERAAQNFARVNGVKQAIATLDTLYQTFRSQVLLSGRFHAQNTGDATFKNTLEGYSPTMGNKGIRDMLHQWEMTTTPANLGGSLEGVEVNSKSLDRWGNVPLVGGLAKGYFKGTDAVNRGFQEGLEKSFRNPVFWEAKYNAIQPALNDLTVEANRAGLRLSPNARTQMIADLRETGGVMGGRRLEEILSNAGLTHDEQLPLLQKWANAGEESTQKALAEANRLHYDYSNRTNFDAVLGGVVPFSTWATRNVPYSVGLLGRKPYIGTTVSGMDQASDEERQKRGLKSKRFNSKLPLPSWLDPALRFTRPGMQTWAETQPLLLGARGQMFDEFKPENAPTLNQITGQQLPIGGDVKPGEVLSKAGQFGFTPNPMLTAAPYFAGMLGEKTATEVVPWMRAAYKMTGDQKFTPLTGIGNDLYAMLTGDRREGEGAGPLRQIGQALGLPQAKTLPYANGVGMLTGDPSRDYQIRKTAQELYAAENGRPMAKDPDAMRQLNDPNSYWFKRAAEEYGKQLRYQGAYQFGVPFPPAMLSGEEATIRQREADRAAKGLKPDYNDISKGYQYGNQSPEMWAFQAAKQQFFGMTNKAERDRFLNSSQGQIVKEWLDKGEPKDEVFARSKGWAPTFFNRLDDEGNPTTPLRQGQVSAPKATGDTTVPNQPGYNPDVPNPGTPGYGFDTAPSGSAVTALPEGGREPLPAPDRSNRDPRQQEALQHFAENITELRTAAIGKGIQLDIDPKVLETAPTDPVAFANWSQRVNEAIRKGWDDFNVQGLYQSRNAAEEFYKKNNLTLPEDWNSGGFGPTDPIARAEWLKTEKDRARSVTDSGYDQSSIQNLYKARNETEQWFKSRAGMPLPKDWNAGGEPPKDRAALQEWVKAERKKVEDARDFYNNNKGNYRYTGTGATGSGSGGGGGGGNRYSRSTYGGGSGRYSGGGGYRAPASRGYTTGSGRSYSSTGQGQPSQAQFDTFQQQVNSINQQRQVYGLPPIPSLDEFADNEGISDPAALLNRGHLALDQAKAEVRAMPDLLKVQKSLAEMNGHREKAGLPPAPSLDEAAAAQGITDPQARIALGYQMIRATNEELAKAGYKPTGVGAASGGTNAGRYDDIKAGYAQLNDARHAMAQQRLNDQFQQIRDSQDRYRTSQQEAAARRQQNEAFNAMLNQQRQQLTALQQQQRLQGVQDRYGQWQETVAGQRQRDQQRLAQQQQNQAVNAYIRALSQHATSQKQQYNLQQALAKAGNAQALYGLLTGVQGAPAGPQLQLTSPRGSVAYGGPPGPAPFPTRPQNRPRGRRR